MQFNTYTVTGAHVAAWLVSQPRPVAAELTAPALTALLAGYDVHAPAVTGGDVRALAPWTARLRPVFEADGPQDRARLADGLLTAAGCRPRLVSHALGQPFHLHYAPLEASLAQRVRAMTAGGLAQVVDQGEGARLRACARDGCAVAFLDTSRNGRRVFCSVRCANQVNVATHRRRLAATRTAGT
jgi:hypothetical protein